MATEEAMNRFIEHLKTINTEGKKQPSYCYKDSVGHWLLAECDQDLSHRTTMKDLYRSYRIYCEMSHVHPLGNSSFGKQLTKLGFPVIRGAAGSIRWGLGLKTPLPETSPTTTTKEPIIFIGTTNEMLGLMNDFDFGEGEK